MLPDVLALQKNYKKKEASIIIFNSNKEKISAKQIKKHYDRAGIKLPVFLVKRDLLVKYCDLSAFPGMWIVDKDGNIVTTAANNLSDATVKISDKLGKKVDAATREKAKKPIST